MKWDDKGLAVAIAQNVDTGAILMQGFVNRDALATTISSRKATFYSRSRSKLWTKGESSMNFINIHDIFLDCDRDSVSSDHFHYILFVLILCTLFFIGIYANLSGNIPWEAWWPYLPHGGRNLLLHISFWFLEKFTGSHTASFLYFSFFYQYISIYNYCRFYLKFYVGWL